MKVESKFSPDDNVLVIYKNKIYKTKVISVEINCSNKSIQSERYKLAHISGSIDVSRIATHQDGFRQYSFPTSK